MQDFKLLCGKWEYSENKYLQYDELCQLQEILFDETEKDVSTEKVIKSLKEAIDFTLFRKIPEFAIKFNLTNSELFQVLCDYPKFAQKCISNLQMYPNVFKLLSIFHNYDIVDDSLLIAIYPKANNISDAYLSSISQALEDNKNLILAYSPLLKYVAISFSCLIQRRITNQEIYHAVCENAQYAFDVSQVFEILIKAGIKKEAIYLAVCNKSKYAADIYKALIILKKAGIENEEVYDVVCNNAKNSKKIAKVLVEFNRIGYLNTEPGLLKLIARNTDYAQDISKIFTLLGPIGLFSNQDMIENSKAVFGLGKNAKDIKPLFEFLMEKSDLFKSGQVDIILMRKLPAEYRLKNTIVVDQATQNLYHFDENGKRTEILDEKLKFKIKCLFTRTPVGETENIINFLDETILIEIKEAVTSQGCQFKFDNRQINFEIVCQNAGYVKDILPILKHVNLGGLILQSTFVAAFKNKKYAESIYEVFCHLKALGLLNQSNIDLVFKNAKYAKILLTAIVKANLIPMLLDNKRDLITALCQHPEHAQHIASMFSELAQTDIKLANADNIKKICENAKYSAGISSACRALFSADVLSTLEPGSAKKKLTQEMLDSFFANPTQAIFTAFGNGGKMDEVNDGLREVSNIIKVCKPMRFSPAFFYFPIELKEKIASISENPVLDKETREVIINTALTYKKETPNDSAAPGAETHETPINNGHNRNT